MWNLGNCYLDIPENPTRPSSFSRKRATREALGLPISIIDPAIGLIVGQTFVSPESVERRVNLISERCPRPRSNLLGYRYCSRASQSPEPVQQPSAAEEEAQEQDRVHEPTDLRAGEAVPLPEVLEPGGQGRDRRSAGTEQRAGDHVVPEPKGEAQEGHGGAEEGRADGEPAPGRPAPQNLPGERTGPGYPEEKTSAQLDGREVVGYHLRAKRNPLEPGGALGPTALDLGLLI